MDKVKALMLETGRKIKHEMTFSTIATRYTEVAI